MIHTTILSKISATGMAALLAVCLSSCSATDGLGDSDQPLPLTLSAKIVPQGSATLTRSDASSNTVAVKMSEESEIKVGYKYRDPDMVHTLYTAHSSGNGYSLTLKDGESPIIYYPNSTDNFISADMQGIFTISSERTDGTPGVMDVPFLSTAGCQESNPSVTKDIAAGTAAYTLPLGMHMAGIRLKFHLATELKAAGYTYTVTAFEPKIGPSDIETDIDRSASLAATSTAVIGHVYPNTLLAKGTAIGIATVTYTNATENTTDTRRLLVSVPADFTPAAGQLYTYGVTLSRSEALVANAVDIATFTAANGDDGQDIVQGNVKMVNMNYDFSSINSTTDLTPIYKKLGGIKTRIAALPANTLTNLTITGLTTAINGAFMGLNGNPVMINLPDAETVQNAFRSSASIKSVNLPKVTAITSPAFNGCEGLTSVYLPKVEKICSNTFANCTSLKSIDLPKATELGSGTFQNCPSLTSANLPNATTIADWDFKDCTSLTSVTLTNATTVTGGAFTGCTSLTSVTLTNATTVTGGAFTGCTSLASVNLPNATTVESAPFYGCTKLASITLPKLKTVGAGSLVGCTNLTSLSLTASGTIEADGHKGSFQSIKTANCDLILNEDKKIGGTGSPLVTDDHTWANCTWKSIKFVP